ncbi:MAG: hypothetical protein COC24_003485 [Alphaproteobacteria bacterium]|nr:hypothetical protein [Alphaproteobacteria bacterium]
MGNEYLSTDTGNDVICSLELVLESLIKVENNPNHWKWVVIALHCAIQGTMVLHLTGTVFGGAYTQDSIKRFIKWSDSHRIGEKAELHLMLANPFKLFKRLSDETRSSISEGGIIVTTEKQHLSFKWLDELRDGFTHFKDTSWSIEVELLRGIVKPIIEVIEMIEKRDWAFRHLSDEKKECLKALINEISLHSSFSK